ncbi:MAG: TonB-dependent receptor, partial [Gammaproteobacteria bacterium]|nr:TonB-dependent receptor [Gammaproteobacteria bacterium]
RGYELEIEQSIGTDWSFNASLSLQDYADGDLPGAAPWMFKLGAEHRLLPLTTIHLQLNSIADRAREANDTRPDFEQTIQADITLRTQNFLDIPGLDFRVGLHNLLDEELKHPAPVDTYPGDYPYSDGVTIWARLVYQP